MIALTQTCAKLLIALVLLPTLAGHVVVSQSSSPSKGDDSKAMRSIKLLISTDQKKYSLLDSVELDVALRNVGDTPVYMDRRLEWGGYGGGLKLDIRDEQGRNVPLGILNDAILPPPQENDSSVLVRLDEGRFYGTWVNLPTKQLFHSPGRYSIRVVYKSWLRKEYLESHLRSLPGIWSDDPPIVSEPIWIEIVP
jgi:hypothetical protein